MKSMAGTLLWILIFLSIAAGCDGGTDPNSTSASASVIYRGNGGDPGSLDPALAEDVHAFNILTDLYEGLVAESAIGELVSLPIVDPRTEFNMYRAGELGITNTVPPEPVQSLKETMPSQLRIAPSLALYYLAFDLTEPPLNNRQLRQALNMAIDREQLVSLVGRSEQAAYGIVPLYIFVSQHLVRPGIIGFENNVLDRHPSKYLAIVRED